MSLKSPFGVCFLCFETASLNRIFWSINAVLAGVLSDMTLQVYGSNADQSLSDPFGCFRDPIVESMSVFCS